MPNVLGSGQEFSNQTKDETGNIEVRVIGVGLPRTGTSSIKAALEILGFGPCHHMAEIFKKPSEAVEFIRAYKGENVDFRELLKGYGSTIDCPSMDFYKQIHKVYPEAKLLLSVRDNDEKWYQSFQDTIGMFTENKFYYFIVYPVRFLRLQYTITRKAYQKWMHDYNGIQSPMHSQHNERILSENELGSVFTYNVKDGWEPLCHFLNVPVPEGIPFPHVHDTSEFQRNVKFAKMAGLAAWFCLGSVTVLSSYLLIKMTH